jgi:transketolase
MIGGAADLSESTKTEFPGGDAQHFTRERSGRNLFFGVREHGMGGIVNGMGAHGGIVRPYGSTFMQFTDYMRGSIRLSALSALKVAWVYTHDSVALGEDGPTHQPVEHLAALRAIPRLVVLRPGDPNETAYAWQTILSDIDGPALMALSRQDLPVQASASAEGVARGAYVIRPCADGVDERAAVVGTGGELWVAIAAAEQLEAEGIGARVVSMPSWELFRAQDDDYRFSVLPVALASVSVEAGVSMGWTEWVDASVAIDRFGASAPGQEVLDKLGITPDAVAAKVKELLD